LETKINELTKKPEFGPPFQSATSKLYRSEYGIISLAIAAYLVWRWVYVASFDLPSFIFFVLLPDLAAFIPIGLSAERQRWPSWGPDLYNLFHTISIWVLVFALAWLVLKSPYFPLLGWLLHITADRSLGFALRGKPPKGSA